LNSHGKTGAVNLIPIEFDFKIPRKIKAKERFAAYIVIPMWPKPGRQSDKCCYAGEPLLAG
jgi:hypothetical protein